MSLDDRQKTFIGYLLNLAKEGQEDRGALADLRSGLGKEPGQMARVHRHVVPYLPEQRYNDRWYYVTATLFGSFPKHRKGRSLGAAFQPLRAKSDSMETRFVALLNAHPDDLDDHLRHIVRLLESAKPPQPLDWFRLFDDLLQWNRLDGDVQLKWAGDFYKNNNSGGDDTSQSSTTSEKKEIENHE